MGGIFGRFPGSCDRYLKLMDTSGCNLVCEPFAGSASLTVQTLGNGVEAAVLGETDPTVQVCLMLAQRPELAYYFQKVITLIKKQIAEDQAECWDWMKSVMEDMITHGVGDSDGEEIAELAAVSYCYRALAYAGIVRTAKRSKKINVKPGPDQLRSFPERKISPYMVNDEIHLHLAENWRQAISNIPKDARAFLLLDPPYYSAEAHMEPCYPGHRPKAKETLFMARGSLTAALKHPGVFRVVMKNYRCQALDKAVNSAPPGWYCTELETGKMEVGAKGGGTKGKNIQVFWFFSPTAERLISNYPVEVWIDERDRLRTIAASAPAKGWIESGMVKGKNFRQAWWRGIPGKNTQYIGRVGSAKHHAARSAQLARKHLRKLEKAIAQEQKAA